MNVYLAVQVSEHSDVEYTKTPGPVSVVQLGRKHVVTW